MPCKYRYVTETINNGQYKVRVIRYSRCPVDPRFSPDGWEITDVVEAIDRPTAMRTLARI